ncbi:GntR family transcriptional regulator [Roseivivax sediminis]|uniref:DNA-binding transcriptional regulator, GntR family n=1 Tax=Roseivivax sediminis TaxID=936889 RepID=A0A1I1W9U8_9RHOB|nr:GntR family transcriptional regulator [Roseivivax sediminis]SFD91779.1 DNA-binding transcriptional regulator, GntR family [Roseivivax sediminis]
MHIRRTSCSYSTAYLGLRDQIIRGDYKPGSRLGISLLANEFRMSPTPVREALSRLAQEDIIETRQQRGFFIKEFNPDEIAELYALIHLNVAFLMRRTASNGALPTVADEISDIFAAETATAASRHVFRFRDRLADHAGSPNAAQTLHNLFLRTHFIRVVEFSNRQRHAKMKSIAVSIARAARRDDRQNCFRALDRLFLQRAEWFPTVTNQASNLAAQIGKDGSVERELKVAE